MRRDGRVLLKAKAAIPRSLTVWEMDQLFPIDTVEHCCSSWERFKEIKRQLDERSKLEVTRRLCGRWLALTGEEGSPHRDWKKKEAAAGGALQKPDGWQHEQRKSAGACDRLEKRATCTKEDETRLVKSIQDHVDRLIRHDLDELQAQITALEVGDGLRDTEGVPARGDPDETTKRLRTDPVFAKKVQSLIEERERKLRKRNLGLGEPIRLDARLYGGDC